MSVAENLLLGLVKSLGIQPSDMRNVVDMVQRLNSVLAEIDEFKAGAAAMVRHFDARIDRLDAALTALAPAPEPVHKPSAIITFAKNGDHGHV